jgi:cold shock protein
VSGAVGWREPVFGQTGRPGIEKRNMSTGTVKFFSDERGFGFISREVGEDVFVHHSNIDGEGHRSLAEGDRVEFEVGPGRKGEEARNVRVI